MTWIFPIGHFLIMTLTVVIGHLQLLHTIVLVQFWVMPPKKKPNNFITSPLIDLSEVSTTSHLKWEEFILHSNFTKYYEVIITEQNDINSILTAAVTPVYNGNPTTLVPNRTLKSVQIPSTFLGKKIYVTFRHHQPNNTTGTGILFIYNVSI